MGRWDRHGLGEKSGADSALETASTGAAAGRRGTMRALGQISVKH